MPKLNFTELLIATNNKGKAAEFRELFKDLPVRLLSLNDLPAMDEPDETGSTFEENAGIKATEYAVRSGMYAFSDDSGLEVDALGGLPGVHSARYAGKDSSYAFKNSTLLAELDEKGGGLRTARFTSVITLAAPDGTRLHSVTGVCSGQIAKAPAGDNGFGYDPIFIPDGYEMTFGQMPDAVKSNISHRAQASLKFIRFLRDNLNN